MLWAMPESEAARLVSCREPRRGPRRGGGGGRGEDHREPPPSRSVTKPRRPRLSASPGHAEGDAPQVRPPRRLQPSLAAPAHPLPLVPLVNRSTQPAKGPKQAQSPAQDRFTWILLALVVRPTPHLRPRARADPSSPLPLPFPSSLRSLVSPPSRSTTSCPRRAGPLGHRHRQGRHSHQGHPRSRHPGRQRPLARAPPRLVPRQRRAEPAQALDPHHRARPRRPRGRRRPPRLPRRRQRRVVVVLRVVVDQRRARRRRRFFLLVLVAPAERHRRPQARLVPHRHRHLGHGAPRQGAPAPGVGRVGRHRRRRRRLGLGRRAGRRLCARGRWRRARGRRAAALGARRRGLGLGRGRERRGRKGLGPVRGQRAPIRAQDGLRRRDLHDPARPVRL